MSTCSSDSYVDITHVEDELEAYISQKKMEINVQLADIVARRTSQCYAYTAGSDDDSTHLYPKNPRWYIEEDNVVFLVESQRFRVPRYAFQRGSPRFRQLVEDHTVAHEGTLRRLPIRLPRDITSTDFERFLDVLYPLVAGCYPMHTTEEWISVLRVAHHLQFDSHKTLAISQLYTTAAPIDKIVCSHEFGVTEWLEEAYLSICSRPEPLTLEEGMRVGMPTFTKIAAAREMMRGSMPAPPRTGFLAVIRVVFWPEDASSRLSAAPEEICPLHTATPGVTATTSITGAGVSVSPPVRAASSSQPALSMAELKKGAALTEEPNELEFASDATFEHAGNMREVEGENSRVPSAEPIHAQANDDTARVHQACDPIAGAYIAPTGPLFSRGLFARRLEDILNSPCRTTLPPSLVELCAPSMVSASMLAAPVVSSETVSELESVNTPACITDGKEADLWSFSVPAGRKTSCDE